ncbi:SPASM domain-containing protein [Paracraurococcus ruber]|uniref:4Fe4S-binding SPASM domain-containing protein n=1 Tax=Paracraurococcus ruber TaxID=77675 RepID=A0ABS1D059_9PROT|nr:SPASM domain-containing protein [Paracraurococcus ruber]MBK1660176.1 hypothetical protein [Paracraurococcus ruber]TDG28866.1 hypothetical protein E2C05_19330 [Paracraurococcus ruber]
MSATRYAAAPDAARSTRDCTDPWFFVLFNADRTVAPCCWHPPVARLAPGDSLEAALNGAAIKAVRRELLTGRLNAACADCPARGLTDPVSLAKRVQAEMAALRG